LSHILFIYHQTSDERSSVLLYWIFNTSAHMMTVNDDVLRNVLEGNNQLH